MDTLVHQVYDAYSKVGFAYITNHGVDSDLIDDIFEASHQFHALSVEDKLRIEWKNRQRENTQFRENKRKNMLNKEE